MHWAYGVTTVSQRVPTYLPQTLQSLAVAGFDDPHLFVDNWPHSRKFPPDGVRFGALRYSIRNPRLKTMGNWILAAWELYLRHPDADRFAVFQDDLEAMPSLREWLDMNAYPDRAYLNLFTLEQNHPDKLRERYGTEYPSSGWYPSNQKGKGALALVFSNEALRTLLSSPRLVERMCDASVPDPNKGVDAVIIESMKAAGWREFVHYPSLTRHIGEITTMGNFSPGNAVSFNSNTLLPLS